MSLGNNLTLQHGQTVESLLTMLPQILRLWLAIPIPHHHWPRAGDPNIRRGTSRGHSELASPFPRQECSIGMYCARAGFNQHAILGLENGKCVKDK